MKIDIIRQTIKAVPAVKPYLTGRARWMAYEPTEYKTYDYFQSVVERLVRDVYGNNLGGEFIDIMANLIGGQLTDAYQQAMIDEGITDFIMPGYLQSALDNMILNQFNFVDQFFRDIVDARIDGTPIQPLLARAGLWAQRWKEAYNEAIRLITLENGGNLIWNLGRTEKHCSTCGALNGIVARASEWEMIGVRPQSAPNSQLECGGWKCDCSLDPTDQRRTANAYGRIEEALL